MRVTLTIEYHTGMFSMTALFRFLKACGVRFHVNRVIHDNKTIEIKPLVTVDYIRRLVSYETGTPETILTKRTRKRTIVENRQIAMALSYKHAKTSYAYIGMEMGGFDHATVMSACKTVNNLRETDRNFRNKVESIEKKLIVNS
jgi:ATPase involved in DNA replication initiation